MQVAQTVLLGKERAVRLVVQDFRHDLGFFRSGDVGRITDQHVQPLRQQRRREHVPLNQGQTVSGLQAADVAGRHGQGPGAVFQQQAPAVRQLQSQRDADAARARAQIRKAHLPVPLAFPQHDLQQQLGLRPGDEGLRADLEIAAEELAPPGDVGQRFTGAAAGGQGADGGGCIVRHRGGHGQHQADAVKVQHMACQQAGLQRGGIRACGVQVAGQRGQQFLKGHILVLCAAGQSKKARGNAMSSRAIRVTALQGRQRRYFFSVAGAAFLARAAVFLTGSKARASTSS